MHGDLLDALLGLFSELDVLARGIEKLARDDHGTDHTQSERDERFVGLVLGVVSLHRTLLQWLEAADPGEPSDRPDDTDGSRPNGSPLRTIDLLR